MQTGQQIQNIGGKKVVLSRCSLHSPIKHHDDGDNDDGYYDHHVGDDDRDDNDDSNL